MAVTIDDYVYTGDGENDTATATWHDEEFNLGTGTDEIDFTANAGYYGNDTIITNSGEDLNLILPTFNYYIIKDGNDIKITTYTNTKYVLTALVTAVNDDFTLEGDGDIDINYAIENNRIKFYLEYDSSKGGYIWKRYLCDNGDQDGSGTTISLTNSILAADTFTRDDVTFSDFEIKKVPYATINNVYSEGASLEDITEAYMSALNESVTANGENNYYFNNNYLSTPSLTSTITLEDYALDDKGTVTINGNDIEVNLTEKNKTSYIGSRLNEYVTINSYYSTPNTDETVDLKTGDNTVYVNIGNNNIGNDVITLNENENLKIVFDTSIKEQIEYSIDGNDIVLTVYGYQTYGYSNDPKAFVDRSRILGTITILNGANEELFESGSTTTLTFETSNGESINYLLYMGDRNSAQNQDLMGTFRDEKFLVGFGNDTVKTNGGNNKILIQRPGNNTIELTEGENSVDTITVSHPGRNVYEPSYFAGYSDPNQFNSVTQSKTVIKNSDHYDTIDFYRGYNAETPAYMNFYKKENSNDLDVIIRNGAYECGSTARYTIENYFADKIKIINSYGYTFAYDGTNNKFIRTYTSNGTTTDYTIKNLIEGSGNLTGSEKDEGIIATSASAASTISTGDGNDIIYTNSATDTIVIDGAGKKQIMIDPNSGNDIIDIQNTSAEVVLIYDTYNISRNIYSNDFSQFLSFAKSGDDIIINHVGKSYNPQTKQNFDTPGSVTIKNYFANEYPNIKVKIDEYNSESNLVDVLNGSVTFDVIGKTNVSNTLVGSKYSENFIGGNKNDTISTGSGNDIITTGKGKDTINIDGTGNKTIVIKKGDGAITVNGVNNSTSTNINAEEFNNNQICWSKSGNNIVLHFLNLDTLTSDDITISNYFREDGSVNNEIQERLKIKGNAFSTSTFSNFVQGKKIKSVDTPISLVGTGKKDVITSNVAGDIVYAGNGNDTIYVNNTSTIAADTNIYAGKGKDKIIVKDALFEEGSGITNINLSKDDGNKTVVITEELKNALHTLNINFLSSNNYSRSNGYFKNGNDLIIKVSYNPYSSTAKSSQVAVTVKNYFKWDLSERVQINNESVSYKDLSIMGIRNKKKKVTEFIGTNNRDTITGTKKADYITTGANYDTITPGKGNDTVYIDGTGSKTIYIHNGDGNDTVKYKESISDTKQYLALQYDSSAVLSGTRNGDDYIISRTYDNNKTFTTETTTIKDYYKEGFGGGIHSSLRPDSLTTKVEGNAKKTNNITVESNKLTLNGKTTAGEEGEFNNILITAGKKNDTVVTTASNTKIFTGAGNDKVTLNGEGYSYAYTGAGKDNVTISAAGYGRGYAYTGDGNDTITATSGYSNCIYTGNGNDTVTITGGSNTIYLKGGEGNDTIIHEGSDFDNTILSFSNYIGTKNYHKSGNDLLIKYAYKNGKKKTKTETHTIKDYFIKDSAENGSLGTKIYIDGPGIASTLYSQGLNLPGKYDKKQKATIFEGTEYKDIITGTKKKDIITTGNGDDKIELGKGDDKITINGTGTKNITIANGDGNDTVEFAENTVGTVSFKMDNRDLFYVSDYNNKVDITRIYEVNGNVKKETTSVIRTSEDSSLQNILINNNALSALTQYQDVEQFEANKPNTVTSQNIVVIGGNKNDDITLIGNCSAAFAGKGNDKITVGQGNSVITGGKGNDTIIINSSNVQQVGNVTINHAKGDGNDTVEFAGDNKATSLTVNVSTDVKYDAYYMNYFNNNCAFRKHGNDLILNIPKSNKSHETVTLKDYFAEDSNVPANVSFNISFKNLNQTNTNISNWKILTDGIYDSNKKATVYEGAANYYAYYKYSGKNKAIMYGENKADVYIAALNKKTDLTISDKGGSDTILLTADNKNLRAFFNVDNQGKVLVDENTNSDNFILFNKANLTAGNLINVLQGKGKGVINIDNFFAQNTSSNSYVKGTGYIEQILVSKNMAKNYTNIGNGGHKYIQQVYTNNWINSVAESVSGWLTDKGYANTMEVLESGNSKDISSLIKVYAGVKCETVALGG